MAEVNVAAMGQSIGTNAPIDMEAFEQDKENIRPSRSGRNPAILAEAVIQHKADPETFSTGASSFDDLRSLEREDFESRLALLSAAAARGPEDGHAGQHAAGNVADALVQLWCDYSRWAAEWFPADCQEERSVLERATSTLSECPQCYDNPQHLRLWLRLADLQQEPQDIFSFLWTRGIGLAHAGFYEAWSASLERQRRFDEADEILAIGAARGAQPAGRLSGLREAFAGRMRGRVRRSAEEIEFGGRPGEEQLVPAAECRPTLNALSAAEGLGLTRPTERRDMQGSALQVFQGTVAAPRDSASAPSAFLDEAATGEPARASIFDARAAWLTAPAKEATTTKENSAPRAKAAGLATVGRTRPRQGDRRPVPRAGVDAGGFAIFVDEECEAPPMQDSPPAQRARASGAQPADATPAARQPDSLSALQRACAVQVGTPRLAPPIARSIVTPPGTASIPLRPGALSAARPARQAPNAPNRELRRRRPEEPEEAANDLAASLSSLRLSDQPPAKRARAGLNAFGSGSLTAVPAHQESQTYCQKIIAGPCASTLNVSAMDTADLVCTPPRPRATTLRAELFGESSGCERPGAASIDPASPVPRRASASASLRGPSSPGVAARTVARRNRSTAARAPATSSSSGSSHELQNRMEGDGADGAGVFSGRSGSKSSSRFLIFED